MQNVNIMGIKILKCTAKGLKLNRYFFFTKKEEREEIMKTVEIKASTKAMKVLLSVLEGSSANDKWTRFVEILEKKGICCML